MPKVRASSGTMGTTRLPMFLSLISVESMRTNAMVVDIPRLSVPLRMFSNALRSGTSSGAALRRLTRNGPPMASVRCLRYCISGLPSGGL